MILGDIAFFIPLKSVVDWNKQEHTIDFIFDSTKELPKIDFTLLNLMSYSVSQ